MKHNPYLVIIIFVSFVGRVLAQNSTEWPYQHVDKKAGLSNSAITSIYSDSKEFVWFGSWDGLNRYDGSQIQTFRPDPFMKGTLSNNIVRDILEDGKGRLWIVTHSGINKFNPNNNTFEAYFSNTNLPFQEYNLKACKGPDSMVWIAINGWGTGRYSAKQDKFLPVTITALTQDWLKTIIGIGSYKDCLYLLGRRGKMICSGNNKVEFSFLVDTTAILQSNKFLLVKNHMILALPAENGDLVLYDLTGGKTIPVRLRLSHSVISSLSTNLKHDAIWAGTESGEVYKILPEKEGFNVVAADPYLSFLSEKKLKILSITETNQNILWIGTDGDGVYKFLTRERPFYSIPYGPAKEGQLSQSIVRCIYENAGKIYIGTRGGGLNIIEVNKMKTRVYNSGSGLSNNAVLSLNGDSKGNIWIGVDGEGLDMMETSTDRIFHFPRDFGISKDITFASVYAICVDSNNELWLGTSGYGVIHLKIEKHPNGRYYLESYEKVDPQGKTMKSNIVYSIVEDKPHSFWIGTRFGGVYNYNSLTKDFEAVIQTGTKRPGLINNDVLSLCKDSGNKLWIGTSGGLNCLTLNTNPARLSEYTQYDGLPNNTIHGVLEDKHSNIWISTNNGLSMLNSKNKSFKNFDWNDGLQNNEFTDGAAYKSPNANKLYFGGIEGLDIVYPDKLDTSSFFPRLAFTEFQVHNIIVNPGDSTNLLSQQIDQVHQLTLNYKQNFITFHFTALDFWNKQRCKFAYYLENFDKDWIYINKQNFVNLINIPPGKYRFKLKYTNENGTWNADTRSILIIIKPPFWATTFAYVIYGLVLIALQAGLIVYIRKKARQKKKIAIERFKREKEEELLDYKLQFFTNIAHEFRTPLTLIMGPAVNLLKKAEDVLQKKYLTVIYKNSLRLQKLIQELIEFRKMEIGKIRLEVSETDINEFTKEIVETFQEYAFDREITLNYLSGEYPFKGYIDKNKAEKILVNLISNAIKYTRPQGRVNVKLSIRDGMATFEIKDTGIGIPPEIIDKIFDPFFHSSENYPEIEGIAKGTGIGLSLTKSLIDVHNGSIKIESRVGEGSTFTFTLPLIRAAHEVVVPSGEQLITKNRLKEKIKTEFESSEYDTPKPLTYSQHSEVERNKEYQLLVVDDNPQVLLMLKDIIPERYGLHLSNSGSDALKILDKEKIDLVISDVIMPEIDGLELCQRIKDSIETSHIPVILLTEKAEIEHRIEGLQVGADSYIPKPFHPDHLLVRVEKLIQTREKLRSKFKTLANTSEEVLAHGLGKKDEEFIAKVVEYIQTEMNNPELDATHIASYINMSKTSLYKKIKSITGLSPHLLINQYRLKKAAQLLKNSEMNVSEIIDEIGFNSRSYFYKSFNEMFNCSPKDYK